jgi:translation initiation factor 1
MNEVCQKCGLPRELCVCETIAKEAQKIQVMTIKRRYGKLSTIVKGIDPKSINMKEMTKKLKMELACGGTIKDNIIELQGDHRKKIKEILIKIGFPESQIDVR